MITLKRILHPTDFSRCANQAFWHAIHLSRKYQAELYMLHAIVLHEDDPHHPTSLLPDIDTAHKQLKELSLQNMDYLLESYHAEDIKAKKAEERGIATASIILEYVKKKNIDLIVMGTHGRRGFKHLLLGSVAEEVVRLASCPVLTIREQKQPKRIEDLEKILIPVDFSDNAWEAFSYAKEIAIIYQAKLQFLHVIEEAVHPAFYLTGKSSIFDLVPDIKAKSIKAFKRILKETEMPEVDIEYAVIEGKAAHEIVKFAEKHDTDLIVITTHGLTGLEHFFLGSVAEKVIRRSPCPVFIVKAFGKKLI